MLSLYPRSTDAVSSADPLIQHRYNGHVLDIIIYRVQVLVALCPTPFVSLNVLVSKVLYTKPKLKWQWMFSNCKNVALDSTPM